MKQIGILFLSLFIFFGCKKDDSLSVQEQFAVDLEMIDSYLDENGIQAEIHERVQKSILQYSFGDGDSPNVTNSVTVKYKGLFFDGRVFDQSSSLTFNLTGLIPAWQIMIPELNVGGKITMYAPSGYCYGTRGFGSTIPPNASLIFEVELLDIN